MHLLPLQRVDAVRDPHPVRPLEHAEVDPGPAGGAGLDLQARMGGLELVQQPIDRERLLVHPGPTLRLGPGVDQVPVVVPLDVLDRVLGQDGQDRVADIA